MPALSRRLVLALPFSALALPGMAGAETWPTHSLRLVVPYPAGGPTDVVARALAARMGEGLGQTIVVDNKPGGAGNIGSEIVAKAPPDGYALVMGNNATHATNQTLIPATTFDAARDFAAIGLTTTVTHVLVVNPEVPAKPSRSSWPGPGRRATRSPMPRPATGRPPIWRWNCSRPRSISRPSTSPIAAPHPPCRISWPAR